MATATATATAAAEEEDDDDLGGGEKSNGHADALRVVGENLKAVDSRILAQVLSKAEGLDICFACNRASDKLQRCTRCRLVLFCNKECLKAGWPAHKKECKKIQRENQSVIGTDGSVHLTENALQELFDGNTTREPLRPFVQVLLIEKFGGDPSRRYILTVSDGVGIHVTVLMPTLNHTVHLSSPEPPDPKQPKLMELGVIRMLDFTRTRIPILFNIFVICGALDHIVGDPRPVDPRFGASSMFRLFELHPPQPTPPSTAQAQEGEKLTEPVVEVVPSPAPLSRPASSQAPQLRELQRQMRFKEEEIHTYQDELIVLKKLLEDRDEEHENDVATRHVLERQVKKEQSQLAVERRSHQILKDRFEFQGRELEKARIELTDCSERLKGIDKKIQKAHAEERKTRLGIETLRDENEGMKRARTALLEEISELRENLTKQQIAEDEVRVRLAAENEYLMGRARALEERGDEYETELESLREDFEQVQSELESRTRLGEETMRLLDEERRVSSELRHHLWQAREHLKLITDQNDILCGQRLDTMTYEKLEELEHLFHVNLQRITLAKTEHVEDGERTQERELERLVDTLVSGGDG